MKEWIVSTDNKENDATPGRAVNGVKGSGRNARSKSAKGRVGKPGRDGSISPDSRLRRQGQQFLNRIEELQKNLEIQGEALNIIHDDLREDSPKRMPGS